MEKQPATLRNDKAKACFEASAEVYGDRGRGSRAGRRRQDKGNGKGPKV